jgi:cytochrome P450
MGSRVLLLLSPAGTESVSRKKRHKVLEARNINNFLAVHQTTSSITTFLLTMVLFPDVQKRVQAELDAVVGRKRLPTFEDRASLPYLEATIKESLRFHPPTPLGIAHRLSEDDVVQGKKNNLLLLPTKQCSPVPSRLFQK